MNGLTGYTLLLYSIRNIIVEFFLFPSRLLSVKAFDFCWKSGDFCIILGYGMKWDTSETDYLKDGNEFFN